jgi:hypothetical protein
MDVEFQRLGLQMHATDLFDNHLLTQGNVLLVAGHLHFPLKITPFQLLLSRLAPLNPFLDLLPLFPLLLALLILQHPLHFFYFLLRLLSLELPPLHLKQFLLLLHRLDYLLVVLLTFVILMTVGQIRLSVQILRLIDHPRRYITKQVTLGQFLAL